MQTAAGHTADLWLRSGTCIMVEFLMRHWLHWLSLQMLKANTAQDIK